MMVTLERIPRRYSVVHGMPAATRYSLNTEDLDGEQTQLLLERLVEELHRGAAVGPLTHRGSGGAG
jgi:hypothetical protein